MVSEMDDAIGILKSIQDGYVPEDPCYKALAYAIDSIVNHTRCNNANDNRIHERKI